jgi:VanZ family protein
MKNHKSLIPLIWLLCIAYGSFIPFHIRTVSFADALNQFRHIPFLDLGAGSRADWVANILLYIPLGFSLSNYIAWKSRSFIKNCLAFGVVFFICGITALFIEFFQIFFSPRTVSINDLIAEAMGSLLGMFLWRVYGQRLKKTWYNLSMESSPETKLQALFVFYLVFILVLSLFPFDFLVSIQEIHRKLDAWNSRPALGHGGMFWLKSLAEAMFFMPVGVFIGLTFKRISFQKQIGRALIVGGCLSFFTEVMQFFMVSGISSGFSVLLKSAGAATGVLATAIDYRSYWGIIRPFAWIAGMLLMPVFLFTCLRLSGWGVSGWIGVQEGLQKCDVHMFIPFYYHYFTTETRAVVSALFNFCIYLPVGIGGCLLSISKRGKNGLWIILPMVAGVGLAGIIETGKLFQAGLHPDFTNLILAGAAAAVGFRLTDYFFPVFRELYDK